MDGIAWQNRISQSPTGGGFDVFMGSLPHRLPYVLPVLQESLEPQLMIRTRPSVPPKALKRGYELCGPIVQWGKKQTFRPGGLSGFFLPTYRTKSYAKLGNHPIFVVFPPKNRIK